MNLFNKRILKERINRFPFPSGNHQKIISKIINGWQIALSEHDLEKTKEKSVQGEFLLKFFESILGYSSHSSGKSEWNLISSPKTEVDSQEADGSLGFFSVSKPDVTKAVIELKDAKTSLDKKQIGREKGYTPIEQGYLYATKFDKCNWIIVSNFKEIRLYNKTRTQDFYETFDVIKLNEIDEFKRFYYILCKENLISQIGNSIIDELVKETNFQEENITKEFYKKYKETRYKLFEHIVYNNPNISKEIILEKTQKIIDRVIFVSFCEDLGLLPPNIFRRILEAVKQSYDLSENKIWNQVKGLFHSINIGNPPMNINKFNGGLFSEDCIFDNLIIKDEVIKELIDISEYDFESDLNVNILGHIFEQSISDIEEMKSYINELETVKKEGKRKREGIYYTPEYITKYIVDQAVGGCLEDRKEELGFNSLPELSEEDYKSIKITKGKVKANIKVEVHIKFWESYREILQNIKVLDPACGSGAFLIQTFDYLYKEGQLVNEELAKLKKGQRQIFDLDKHILTNNIYGVDLNEESVEITKLSLWLKTANKGKELTALDDNIKCGNSLIENPEIVGNKSFKWEEKFKNIIIEGGFDIIIGNPPYGADLTDKERGYLNSKFNIGSTDTAILFIKQSLSLIKNCGFLGFIIPKAFCFASNYKKIRNYTWNDILTIIDCGKAWKEVKLEQSIVIFNKSKTTSIYKSGKLNKNIIQISESINKSDAKEFGFFLNGVSNLEIELAKKIKKNSIMLNNISVNQRGAIIQKYLSNDGELQVIGGAEIQRYGITGIKGKIKKEKIYSDQAQIKDNSILVQRIIAHIENPIDHIQITACIPENKNYIIVDTINQLSIDKNYSPYFIWSILNSNLLNWYAYRFIFGKAIRTMQFDNPITSRLPILNISSEYRKKIETNAREMIDIYKDFKSDLEKSLNIFKVEYKFKKITTKLKNFYNFNFEDFILELKKQDVKLTLEQQDKLYEWFNIKKEKLKNQEKDIYKIKQEIDQELYKLYNFSIEEIKIIESAQI